MRQPRLDTQRRPLLVSARRIVRYALPAILVIALLELATRQFVARPIRVLRPSSDRDLGFELRPGVSRGNGLLFRQEETLYRIGEDGCRVSEGEEPRAADVVVFGSSLSFGLNIAEDDTVAGLLETTLKARGVRASQVANCGVPGHRILATLRAAELQAERKHPRVVVLLVNPSHLEEAVDFSRLVNPRNEIQAWLFERSSLFHLVYVWGFAATHGFDGPLVPTKILAERLGRFADLIRASGAHAVFFLLDDSHARAGAFEQFEPLLEANALHFLHIRAPAADQREYFSDKDRHWSRAGSALVTGEIADVVAGELLGEKPSPTSGPPAVDARAGY